MTRINPITGTPYERTYHTDRENYIEHDVPTYRAIWSRLPLRQKFLNDALFWGYAEKMKLKSGVVR